MKLRSAFAACAFITMSACDVPQTSQQTAALSPGTQASEGDITLAAAAQVLAFEIDRMPDTDLDRRLALVGARAEGAQLVVDISHPFTALPPGFNVQTLGVVHQRLMCDVDIMRSFVQLGGTVAMNLQYSNGRTFFRQSVNGC